jgi:hypothetical protein
MRLQVNEMVTLGNNMLMDLGDISNRNKFMKWEKEMAS